VPGSGLLHGPEEARREVERIGLPVVIKAAAGGGGRGMKIVHEMDDLAPAFELAEAEARAAFGSAATYVERYMDETRHVEVQVLGDSHGNVVHLLERDCSIQRRHQKLLEEAPAHGLDPAVAERLRQAAVAAARRIGYQSAGTLEFLVNGSEFWFMEMNTRIQVEHGVTEMITGVDLVREQIRLAAGEPLAQVGRGYRPRGHALECRLNAEDPLHFLPQPGRISAVHFPGGLGIRVDSHVYEGYSVSPHYDSMLAKVIVHASDREHAIRRMRGALDECAIEGLRTNLSFFRWLLRQEAFVRGEYGTRFVERALDPAAILRLEDTGS
jgi:acetyl-CoA carboxylase biotin carboxylase subunit